MFELVANALVLAGIAILIASLLTVRKISSRLPPGRSRKSWHAMVVLICGFVVGYAGYVAAFWGSYNGWLDLLVPGVFFFGACFVSLSSLLALQTAKDVKRITVLEHETFTDPLTGMYNRRFMQQRLREEASKARRHGFDLAVLLLDLDHFKRVNDEYGHQVGDRLLIEVGHLVARELRDSDILARYGGEELLVIAPNTNHQDAIAVAERLRKSIEEHHFVPEPDSPPEQDIRITVSIGLASYGDHAPDEDSLVGLADANLYRAKDAGRNRVNADMLGIEGTKEYRLA